MDEKRTSKTRTSSAGTKKKIEPKKIKKKKIVKKADSKHTKGNDNVIKYEDARSKFEPKTRVISKNKKAKKINKSKKRNKILIFALIVFSIIALVLLLRFLPFFDTEEILIEGTSKYTTEEIASTLGIYTGQNVFSNFFKSTFVDNEALPYVKKIEVSLGLPNKVILKVEEKVPKYFAFDKENSRFFRLDEEGYILEEAKIEDKTENELLTYAIAFDKEIKFGTKIPDIYIDKLDIYIKIAEEIGNSKIKGKITKVNFENSLTTITLDDKLNIVFPNDTQIRYKVAFLASILEKLSEDVVGVIDMTKENPTFSSF